MDERERRHDNLERSFVKQNFGVNVRRDLQEKPVPREEGKLIDKSLAHLHEQERENDESQDSIENDHAD